MLAINNPSTYLDEIADETNASGSLTFSDSTRASGAQLDVHWESRVSFTYPDTWTLDERRQAFDRLLAMTARSKCMLLIRQLPADVISVVLPQLEEIADYEVRMWRVRNQQFRPNIQERWGLLPVAVD